MARRMGLSLMILVWLLVAWLSPALAAPQDAPDIADTTSRISVSFVVEAGPGAEAEGEARPAYAALRQGDAGEDVKALQRALDALGYLNGRIDGVYGPLTQRAVRAFQGAALLHEEPFATEGTLEALYGKLAVHRATLAVYFAPDHGQRYHASGECAGLKSANRVEQTLLPDAEERGFTPCKICYD